MGLLGLGARHSPSRKGSLMLFDNDMPSLSVAGGRPPMTLRGR